MSAEDGGTVTTLCCPGCGECFETRATTSTRCRRCRRVVRVSPASRVHESKGAGFLLLELSCGHLSGEFEPGIAAGDAEEYLFTCERCSAVDQEVVRLVASLTISEVHAMDGAECDAWLAAHMALASGSS